MFLYPTVSVGSENKVEPQKWSLLQGSYMNSVKNNTVCDLCTAFIDITKAFDTSSMEGLWKLIIKYGCMATPPINASSIASTAWSKGKYNSDNGELSQTFPVSNGVKQGCVVAPTLFSIMFSALLTEAFGKGYVEIDIKYRTDEKLFNLRKV